MTLFRHHPRLIAILLGHQLHIQSIFDEHQSECTNNTTKKVLTPVAGPIFETKNRAIFLERFFGRGITAREQLSRAKNSLDFQ